ncbi:UNVERIFIED_CONTAM: hypothetical protein FKN15_044141 [Acipenser sinensis]
MGLIDLLHDSSLKAMRNDITSLEFWSLIPDQKYPTIKDAALKVFSLYGSTYCCESAFSSMKQVKSVHRSILTDSHLHQLLRQK